MVQNSSDDETSSEDVSYQSPSEDVEDDSKLDWEDNDDGIFLTHEQLHGLSAEQILEGEFESEIAKDGLYFTWVLTFPMLICFFWSMPFVRGMQLWVISGPLKLRLLPSSSVTSLFLFFFLDYSVGHDFHTLLQSWIVKHSVCCCIL